MSQLVKALVNSSGCNLYLNSRAVLVRKLDSGQLEVEYNQKGVNGYSKQKMTADEVVIAAPLEWTGIRFEGFESDPSVTQPTRKWQRLHYYRCYVAARSIRYSYFKEGTLAWSYPLPLYTTSNSYFKEGTLAWSYPLPLYTTSNSTQPWIVIRGGGRSQGYAIYNVQSSVDIAKDNLVHEIFDEVQDYSSSQWDYVYPLNPPITEAGNYQSIILDKHLYSLNALESVQSQMEMSVTSGLNVAKVIGKETGVIMVAVRMVNPVCGVNGRK